MTAAGLSATWRRWYDLQEYVGGKPPDVYLPITEISGESAIAVEGAG